MSNKKNKSKNKNREPVLADPGPTRASSLNKTVLLLALGLSGLIASILMITWFSSTVSPIQEDQTSHQLPVIYPGQIGMRQTPVVNLYFRYKDKEFLVQQSREIIVEPDEKLEEAVLRELIDGPNVSTPDLSGLLPSSTKVLNVETHGDTLYCTFNRDLLLQDASEFNSEQMNLKLRMMTISIVDTLCDLGKYSKIQILIEAPGGVGQQRPGSEFGFSLSSPLDELSYDESIVLTPEKTVALVLDYVANRDYPSAYDFLVRVDESGVKIPPAETVSEKLREIGYIISSYEIKSTTLGPGASWAIVRINIEYNDLKGRTYSREYVPVTVLREGDVWKVPYPTLLNVLQIPKE